jgi:hypothetical protein
LEPLQVGGEDARRDDLGERGEGTGGLVRVVRGRGQLVGGEQRLRDRVFGGVVLVDDAQPHDRAVDHRVVVVVEHLEAREHPVAVRGPGAAQHPGRQRDARTHALDELERHRHVVGVRELRQVVSGHVVGEVPEQRCARGERDPTVAQHEEGVTGQRQQCGQPGRSRPLAHRTAAYRVVKSDTERDRPGRGGGHPARLLS